MNMNLSDIRAAYFIGAGGIGMSALARYFMKKGVVTAGYDRTPTPLTAQLEKEGMLLHYEDSVEAIPAACRNPGACLVVYTPAVPADHSELEWFRNNGFVIEKRAQVLGTLTRSLRGLCVAGTHGKTTTSAMCAHIMHQAHPDCNAFLGGITKNYGTNYILAPDSEYAVIEADEFDRSFHWLRPYVSVITSADPDHLDIYGTAEAYRESFSHYTSLIQPGGALVAHCGVDVELRTAPGVALYSYGIGEGDFRAENVKIGNGEISFDFLSPIENVPGVKLGHPVPVNVDNAVGAMAMAQLCGCSAEELKYGMSSFKGVDRRFDFHLNSAEGVFLTDYAHHPKEIFQSVNSLRQMYRGRRITAMFQPHLYTRTRDFYKEFAQALGMIDEVVLLDIYPAREEPIPGVTSGLIYDALPAGVEKHLITRSGVLDFVRNHDFDVLAVLGAGDVEDFAPQITDILKKRR